MDLAALTSLLEAAPQVQAAWLFGSRARGDERRDSDVDIGILLGKHPRGLQDLCFGLQDELTARLGLPVQLTILDTAPVDLVRRVFREGRLIHERDRAARIAFQIRRRNEYWDFAPTLARTRRLPPGMEP